MIKKVTVLVFGLSLILGVCSVCVHFSHWAASVNEKQNAMDAKFAAHKEHTHTALRLLSQPHWYVTSVGYVSSEPNGRGTVIKLDWSSSFPVHIGTWRAEERARYAFTGWLARSEGKKIVFTPSDGLDSLNTVCGGLLCFTVIDG